MWANIRLQVPATWDRRQDLRRAWFISDELDGFVSRPPEGGIMEDCPDWAAAPTSVPNVAFIDDFPDTPGLGTHTHPSRAVPAVAGAVVTDVWVHWDACRGHGVDDGTSTRQLTADVLAPFVGVAFDGGVSKSVPIQTLSTTPGRWPVHRPRPSSPDASPTCPTGHPRLQRW